MDLMQRRRAMMSVLSGNSGGIVSATGTFTLTEDGVPPVIEHNLGTQKIAVVIYPISKVTASAGYRQFYLEYINTAAFLEAETWTFDWTSYNSYFDGDETVTLPNDYLRVGIRHASPWKTQDNWHMAGNVEAVLNSEVVATDNTFNIGGRYWSSGTYHWIVWKLG